MSAARSILPVSYAPTQPELVNTGVMGTVYVLHFARPLAHARHYIGWTQNLPKRLAQHRAGYGGRLMACVSASGISYDVVHTEAGDRNRERQMKNRSSAARRRCWVCSVEDRMAADGSVAYIQGRTRAHVAQFEGRGQWRSICGYRVVRWWQSVRHTGDGQPTLPWCPWCVARVRALSAAVLAEVER